MPLLEVQNLSTSFHTRHGVARAVDDVSLSLEPGETLGIVGESGSGKSVLFYSILGLVPQPPAKVEGARVLFHGTDLLSCSAKERRLTRGRRIAMVFQDPFTSLNPYLRVSTQLTEGVRLHEKLSRRAALSRAVDALKAVGIQDAAERIHCYPHEFSGGMCQRVMIAMALISGPEILIADEPTTALDVTVQAQILDLIKASQKSLGMSVVFITHDLGVVAGFCDRVQVMYAGRILETGSTRQIFYHSQHPYTQALQRAIPSLHAKSGELYTIRGTPPEPYARTSGCPFQPRCEFVASDCADAVQLQECGAGHGTACTRFQNGDLGPEGSPTANA